jgi:exonuclease SbcC
MIPVKLKMRNFMPYRGDVPPFSFNGIHTACICGDNGNGKSALIDAITWALWGKTRAKSDDELIHLGENEMEVEFDFTVGQQQYRIIRKHAKPKKRTGSGQSSLDLFLANDDGFKVVSGDRMSQTQQKIIDLLHMDYETFINSAFLRQGHADEFTKQPPAKRKEVLANILGLSLYDQLEERAKELARQQQIEKTQLDNAIKDIDQELAQKPEIEAELEQAFKVSEHLEKELKEQELRLNQLRQERQSLENKKLQLAQLEEHIDATKRELERRQEEIKQHSSRIKDYEELIAIRPAIEEGYSQFTQARQLNQELNQKLQLVDRIKDRKIQLEQAIHKAQAGLLADHAVSQSRVAELEVISKRLPQLKNERQNLESERLRLAQLEEELEKKRGQEQELQTLVHELIYTKELRQQEIKEIEEKINLLYSQGDARCPLCETELGQEGLNVIKTKYDADRNSKTESLKVNESELASKTTELEAARKEVYQLELRLNKDRASIQGKNGLLTQAVHEAEESDKKLVKERDLLAEIENRLVAKDFAAQEQEALGEIENELASLKYDSSQHQQVSQQLSALGEYEQQKRSLEEAERLISREQEALVKAEEAARELHHRLESDSQKRQTLVSELNALPQLESNLGQAEAEYHNLTERQKQAQEITGSLKGKLEHLLKQETKKKENESRLSQVAKEEKVYNDLAQAFGKKGIQAMLIEMALPEIETEANRLLGRMTDNRMHVKIEAQRQSKKGELLETLDIKISDELGMRSYEMFSGGEAFRIDFALRIALSRLLAKRAGAPLPTLIIDEGFGTQDSTGMEKIKEAINSIQDDFDKIIVITHIEELKDAFPMRINVIKTAEGSTLEVS